MWVFVCGSRGPWAGSAAVSALEIKKLDLFVVVFLFVCRNLYIYKFLIIKKIFNPQNNINNKVKLKTIKKRKKERKKKKRSYNTKMTRFF